ncbi:carcinine transporter-like, partial [Hyalella azteca]
MSRQAHVNAAFIDDEGFNQQSLKKKQDEISNKTKNPAPLTDLNEELMDFDDIVPYLDKFGRYQKLLFLAMAPFCFNLVLIYFPHIFVTLEPEHWCRVPELLHLPLDVRRNLSAPISAETGRYDSCR